MLGNKSQKSTSPIGERAWVFRVLIAAAGVFGAYTYVLRGGVFCNAQTGNVVLMAIAVGEGKWQHALYYLIPISAYILGALVSELMRTTKRIHPHISWETLLMAVEIVTVVILGLIPDSVPVQLSQVIINFIASMQYNSFRQAEGMPMATTFATNHIRQVGIGLAHELYSISSDDKSHRRKLAAHTLMLLSFTGGAIVGTFFCHVVGNYAIYASLPALAVVLAAMIRSDLANLRGQDKR